MAWTVTEKNIKIHTCIDEVDSVKDTKAAISYKKLKALGAKRRICKNTKEVFFLIETDYELSF
ncbi:MAG: hypothetical protein PEPC_01771 [Peptostreptococcus russellii]